jgi:hypothetical protein
MGYDRIVNFHTVKYPFLTGIEAVADHQLSAFLLATLHNMGPGFLLAR